MPTFATSIDTTSGITVMRIRLMKIVPTGVATARMGAATDGPAPVSRSPSRKPATSPMRTRVVNDMTRILSGSCVWQAACISPSGGGYAIDARLRFAVAVVGGSGDELHARWRAAHPAGDRDRAVPRAHHPGTLDRQRVKQKGRPVARPPSLCQLSIPNRQLLIVPASHPSPLRVFGRRRHDVLRSEIHVRGAGHLVCRLLLEKKNHVTHHFIVAPLSHLCPTRIVYA